MNIVEHTWLAYALEGATDPERIAAGLSRVERHYAQIFADPPIRHEQLGRRTGVALWVRPDRRLRWPLWVESGATAAAWTSAPTGWARIVGPLAPAESALATARELATDPARSVELNPPFVVGVRDRDTEELTNRERLHRDGPPLRVAHRFGLGLVESPWRPPDLRR